MITRTLTRETRHTDVPVRRQFREQIAHLEQRLGTLPPLAKTAAPQHARLLSVSELEQVRDALVGTVHTARELADKRSALTRENRELLARMLESPEEYRWVRITTADIDQLGCRQWQSVPVMGLVGMLAGWWRIRMSSGCP